MGIKSNNSGSLPRRIVWVTVSIVAMVLAMVFSVLWVAARHTALTRALESELVDLQRNTDLLGVMLDEGMTVESVKEVACAPWDDGSGDYFIVESGGPIPPVAPGSRLLTSNVMTHDGRVAFTVGEIVSDASMMRPAMHTVPYVIGFGVITLIVMAVAVNFAVVRLSGPEVRRRQRLDAELDIARRIQQGLIGSSAPMEGMAARIDSLMVPAKEVAGDMCCYSRQGHHLHFMIGDVSGKGIPAAMFMAVTTRLYNSMAAQNMAPAEIMGVLNDALCSDNPTGMFTTAIIGRLDLSNGLLELCNAGHTRPVYSLPGEPAMLLDLPVNMPLGVMDSFEFEPFTHQMLPRARVLLYTDGVTEAENTRLKQFGEKNLLSATESYKGSKLCEFIFRAIKQYLGAAEQNDDIAMIDVCYLGAPSSLSISPSLQSLTKFSEFAEANALPQNLCVALEEAIVNIINHNSATYIKLDISKFKSGITATVEDDGTPFDPTAYSAPAFDPDSGMLPIGGQGIKLIKDICKKVAYQYKDNTNILTLEYETHHP